MKRFLIGLALVTSTILVAQDEVGGIVGGVIGGVIGHQFGSGSGKVAATITGATVGAVIGSRGGRETYNNRLYSQYEPVQVVYREARREVVYVEPRVVYVYSNRDNNHKRQWHNRHYREYARCDNNYRR